MSQQSKPIEILLTGFAPFAVHKLGVEVEVNPSSELIRLLPDELPIPALGTAVKITKVTDIKVSYTTTKEVIDKVYNEKKWDYAIHCGATSRQSQVYIETLARRHGYNHVDTDKLLAPNNGSFVPASANEQESYSTPFNVPELVAHLQQNKKWNGEVVVSENAGQYLCEWVYYGSMRRASKLDTKVLFVHVPGEGGEWTHEGLARCVEDIVSWIVTTDRISVPKSDAAA